MDQKRLNQVRIGLMVTAVIAVIANFVIFGRSRSEENVIPNGNKGLIPASGVATTKAVSSVPGNPDKTVEQMKRVYKLIGNYKARTGCTLTSQGPRGFMRDIEANFKEYGFSSPLEGAMTFDNPDTWLTDERVDKPVNANVHVNPYFFPFRPNGSARCEPKSGTGRDILAMTDVYVHLNGRTLRGDITTFKPIGFFMVLCDDGTIEKIPYEQARFAKSETKYGAAAMFPGQYGIEKVETVSFAEYYHLKDPAK